MTAYQVIRTARLTDRQILDLIDSLAASAEVEGGSIALGDHMNFAFDASKRSEEPLSVLDGDRHAIHYVHLVISSSIHIEFYRGICGDSSNPSVNRQASPYFDEVFLRSDAIGVEGAQQLVACIDVIERALPQTYPAEAGGTPTEVIDVLRAEIAELSGQYGKMLAGLSDERTQFREEAAAQRSKAQEEYEAERQRLAEHAARQEGQFDTYKTQEEANLQRRSEELDRREHELDNRQHMHARRDLREKISEEFKARINRPVVSRSARTLRWLVFGLTLVAGCGIGAFGVDSFGDMVAAGANSDAPVWLSVGYAIRSVVSVAVAVGFVAYAINWLRVGYLDDVRAERRYEKYGHDIDRASFVIETIMEVGERDNMRVPDTWVDGVCRNLFHDRADHNPDETSSNALAALFETIAGARLGPDGAEVTVDRRGARKIAKKMGSG